MFKTRNITKRLLGWDLNWDYSEQEEVFVLFVCAIFLLKTAPPQSYDLSLKQLFFLHVRKLTLSSLHPCCNEASSALDRESLAIHIFSLPSWIPFSCKALWVAAYVIWCWLLSQIIIAILIYVLYCFWKWKLLFRYFLHIDLILKCNRKLLHFMVPVPFLFRIW